MDNSEKKKQQVWLKKLYSWHAWVGFQLAILTFVVVFTGTVATISNEIDWLIHPELRASDSEGGSIVDANDWSFMYAAIKEQYPTKQISYFTSMGASYLTHRAIVDSPELQHQYIQVDSNAHQVTGYVHRLSVQRFFRDFHRYLFMPAMPGLIIVCTFAFILAISLYTGLKTTRNWKTAMWRCRTGQGSRIMLSDSHKLAGIWGCWFVFIMIITGIWYLYEFGAGVSGYPVEPRSQYILSSQQEENELNISSENFSKMVNLAYASHQDWEVTSIIFPTSAIKPVEFRGVTSNPFLRERARRVFIDPVKLDVIGIWSPQTIGVNAYLNEYIDPLHFGTFGGLWSKLVWFIFGLALTWLTISGVQMTWKRTKSSALSTAQLATLPFIVFMLIAFCFYLQRYI